MCLMLTKYMSSKTSVVFGEWGFMQKADELFERSGKVEIILKGWRNKFLLLYVKELMGFPLDSEESKKTRKFRYIIRLFWLGPLMGCYGLALERRMSVDIKEFKDENFVIIEFWGK